MQASRIRARRKAVPLLVHVQAAAQTGDVAASLAFVPAMIANATVAPLDLRRVPPDAALTRLKQNHLAPSATNKAPAQSANRNRHLMGQRN